MKRLLLPEDVVQMSVLTVEIGARPCTISWVRFKRHMSGYVRYKLFQPFFEPTDSSVSSWISLGLNLKKSDKVDQNTRMARALGLPIYRYTFLCKLLATKRNECLTSRLATFASCIETSSNLLPTGLPFCVLKGYLGVQLRVRSPPAHTGGKGDETPPIESQFNNFGDG